MAGVEIQVPTHRSILVTINFEGTGRCMILVAMSEMADQKFANVRSLAKRIGVEKAMEV